MGSCAELRAQLTILQAALKKLYQPPLEKDDHIIAKTKIISLRLQVLLNSLEANPRTRKKH
ncbi:MAG: hypothetical protein CBC46_09490 [Verrucomicrobiaceae bacterium TMED86]|nr:MAG: hypothetical protein CBC46_09490 [Verrucomicrobiaceae bacterium TMED86]